MYVPDLLSCVPPQRGLPLGSDGMCLLALHSAATGSHVNRRAAAVNDKAPSPIGPLFAYMYASMVLLPFPFIIYS